MKNKPTYNELEEKLKTLERKKNIEINEGEQKISKIINSAPLGISTNSLDGYFINVNKEYCNITGYSKEELQKLRFIDITLDEYREKNMNLINDLIAEKIEKVKLKKKYRKKDGTPVDVIINASLLKDKNNKPQYLLGILEDISKQVKKSKQLKKTKLRYKKLFEEAPSPIFLINYKTTNFEEVNPAAEKFLGYSKNELIGKPFSSILTENKQDTKQLLDIVKNTSNKVFNISTKKIITKSKKEKFIDASFSYFYDENEFIQLIAKDITERKIAEENLYTEKNRLELTLNAIDAGIWEWNIKTGNISINDKCAELLGYSKEEIAPLLKDRKKIIHPDDFKKVMNTLDDYVKGKINTYKIQYRLKTKSGDWKWILDMGKVLKKDYKGSPLRILGIYIDISKQKEKENELNIAKEKAQESNKLKSAFLANISHEIRTPMNAILGFLRLINDIESKEKKEYYTNIINQNAELLLNIINDIIDISKIETKQIDVFENKINPNSLLKNLYAHFQSEMFDLNGNKLSVKLLTEGDCTFTSDEEKLQLILTKLINNAIKFTHQGNIEIGCRILSQAKPKIQFYVKDNGIGIHEENKNAIFELFRQTDLKLTRVYGGTGVGLSIAKGFAELLGGNISFDSELKKGSIFMLTLSYDGTLEHHKKIIMIEDENETKKIDYSKLTILVVEDEFFNYEYIKEILLMYNIKVLHAKNGVETVNIFKSEPNIDLILMDIKMPVMNGLEATKIIKKINNNMPIIAQTAYALTGDKEKIIQAGCDDYIAKPIDKDDLMDKINSRLFSKKD